MRKQTLANNGDISVTCDELFPVCGYIHYTTKQKDAYSLFKLQNKHRIIILFIMIIQTFYLTKQQRPQDKVKFLK